MQIGKYVTNFGIIGALLGAIGVSKQTKKMPEDWRRYIVWLVWLLGLILTVASVAKDYDENTAA
ncbi:MAG TPA: hypothetical protein VLZ31_08190 [Microbacteriaceae bacterium]|nr:hypothetical protein [Microbacteriaceae bacterium]